MPRKINLDLRSLNLILIFCFAAHIFRIIKKLWFVGQKWRFTVEIIMSGKTNVGFTKTLCAPVRTVVRTKNLSARKAQQNKDITNMWVPFACILIGVWTSCWGCRECHPSNNGERAFQLVRGPLYCVARLACQGSKPLQVGNNCQFISYAK